MSKQKFWELMNTITHFSGIIFSLLGGVYLAYLYFIQKMPIPFGSLIVYILSLVILFTCSTMLHFQAFREIAKQQLRKFAIFDYSAIYILIAGTYTPYMMMIYKDDLWKFAAWMVVVWGLAIGGVLFQIKYNGRHKYHKLISTLIYIALGWLIMLIFQQVLNVLPSKSLILLVIGGVTYTAGTIFFGSKKEWAHTIWHFFVLGGAASMYASIVVMLTA